MWAFEESSAYGKMFHVLGIYSLNVIFTEAIPPFARCHDHWEALKAYAMLASREGIFVEPASAASLAGVIKSQGRGLFHSGETIVCTLTGHGLKDPDRAIKYASPPIKVKAEKDAVMRVLAI